MEVPTGHTHNVTI